jgi:hypothetical protein
MLATRVQLDRQDAPEQRISSVCSMKPALTQGDSYEKVRSAPAMDVVHQRHALGRGDTLTQTPHQQASADHRTQTVQSAFQVMLTEHRAEHRAQKPRTAKP